MKCDKCNKPAVVHEVTIKNGKKQEVHLCTEHAAEAGFVVHQTTTPINQLLKQFVISHGPGESTKTEGKKCPDCGMTFAAFRRSGTLGCPACYEAFVDVIGPLIEHAQNGATHHVGKVPASADASFDRQIEIRQLTRALDKAIAAEEYERAAALRDQLSAIEPVPEADSGGEV